MNEQKKLKLNWLWAIISPLIAELGHDAIDWLIGKLTQHKEDGTAGRPPKHCPPGYHAVGDECVENDPVPPDPTHP